MTTEAQRLGDLTVAEAVGDLDRHFRLAWSQGGERHRAERLAFGFELEHGDESGFVVGCRRGMPVQGAVAAALELNFNQLRERAAEGARRT
jgi:hypothetical protein